MPDKYKNAKGVYINARTDKHGKDHIDFYDKNPSEKDHSSIHINWDSNTGKGSITDTTSGTKQTTDTSCYLTTACMKYMQDKFDDNCYELTVLRWFRDNFVSKEEINQYYKTAPVIVEAIEQVEQNDIIYSYIYDNVIDYCVIQIENGNYEEAYNRYKNSILYFEEVFIKQAKAKILKK